MEIIKQNSKTTTVFFKLLDYTYVNLFSKIKVSDCKEELTTIDVAKSEYKLEFEFKENNEDIKKILNIELLDANNNSIEFKIDIILNQFHYIYLFINKKNKHLIDFMYKNYSDKKSLSKLKIKYEKDIYELNFNFIDAKGKIGRFIILNSSLTFDLQDVEFRIKEMNNFNWLFCLKNYSNKLDLECHHKNLSPNDDNIKESSKIYIDNDTKKFRNDFPKIFDLKENISTLFIKLNERLKKIYISCQLAFNYFNIPIDNINNFSNDDFINLSNRLFFKGIYLYQNKYKKILENLKFTKNEKNTINDILKNYSNDIFNYNKNFNILYEKINAEKELNLIEKAKKLSIYNSIIIENSNIDIDDIKEIRIEKIDNKNTFYKKAVEIFKEIITNLNYDSLMTECGIELNSKNSENYNILAKEKYSLEINIITLNDLKNHLLELIPKKIYRVYYKSDNLSYYDVISKLLVINENTTFNDYTKDEIENIFDNKDEKGNLTLSILSILFHECFGHAKIRLIDPNLFSPLKFNYKGYCISLLNKDKNPFKESGRIVENFISDFNDANRRFLFDSQKKDVNALLDYKLYIDDLKELNKKIREINCRNDIKITNFQDYIKDFIKLEEENKINYESINNENLLEQLHKFSPEKMDNDYIVDSLLKNYIDY